MNEVFISGIVKSSAVLISNETQTPHARMQLQVTHQTKAGEKKSEIYDISAWHGIAERLCEKAQAGKHITIFGYLSQRKEASGNIIEITVSEFSVSAAFGTRRTLAEPRISFSVNQQRSRQSFAEPVSSSEASPNLQESASAEILPDQTASLGEGEN